MALEWVLLSLMVAVALWLGVDACRESKRLHDRLSRAELARPARLDGAGNWAYWPLTTATSEDLRIGPRL
ncbi:MAG TPA: hypothetical protein VGH89_42525 [Pseudonocardia sp.]|jgi:hypothetical protein